MAERRHEFVNREDLRAVVSALASARQKRGISQRELSRRLDLHPMTIMQIENGGRNLTLVEFFDIARELEADPIEVLRGVFGT